MRCVVEWEWWVRGDVVCPLLGCPLVVCHVGCGGGLMVPSGVVQNGSNGGVGVVMMVLMVRVGCGICGGGCGGVNGGLWWAVVGALLGRYQVPWTHLTPS